MKAKSNQEKRLDDIVEYIYNNRDIPKFTYEDFLKYQAIFHPEDIVDNEVYDEEVDNELDDKLKDENLANFHLLTLLLFL